MVTPSKVNNFLNQHINFMLLINSGVNLDSSVDRYDIALSYWYEKTFQLRRSSPIGWRHYSMYSTFFNAIGCVPTRWNSSLFRLVAPCHSR